VKVRTEEGTRLHQEIQQVKDDLSTQTKSYFELEKQRDQLQSELAHARAGGMSCCAPEWTPMEWTPLQRAEQPSQQSQLDRWAEVALPAILKCEADDNGLDSVRWSFMASLAYECAKVMVEKQCEMREEE
jgi:hypothetical protein